MSEQQAQELTPAERAAKEVDAAIASLPKAIKMDPACWEALRTHFLLRWPAARDAVVERPGESRKPWTGRSLFEFFEHEAERGRGWDSLAERIEREIDGIRGVAGQKIAKLAREAAESPNTSDHENALWEIIDLCAPVASRVSEEPAKSWTIRVCAEPGCGGWAAKHFADAVGIWHDHGGRRVDFVDVEVVPR